MGKEVSPKHQPHPQPGVSAQAFTHAPVLPLPRGQRREMLAWGGQLGSAASWLPVAVTTTTHLPHSLFDQDKGTSRLILFLINSKAGSGNSLRNADTAQ